MDRLQQLVDGGQIVLGLLRHQGVDLDGDSQFGRVLRSVDRPLEASFDAAHGLVPRRGRTVQAKPEALHPVRLQLGQHAVGEVGGGAGRDGDGQPEAVSFVDQIVQVGTAQRITCRSRPGVA